MRLINADKAVKDIEHSADLGGALGNVVECVKLYAKFMIATSPTVDAVEVVRCKDCKHRHLDGMTWNCPFGLSGGENFFCAYGAKDGEADDE